MTTETAERRAIKTDYEPEDVQKGKMLFNSNCAACHKVASPSTGPALAGIDKRITFEEFHQFTTDYTVKAIQENVYFMNLIKIYNKPHTINKQLTQKDTKAIFAFLVERSNNPGVMASGPKVGVKPLGEKQPVKNKISTKIDEINYGSVSFVFAIDTVMMKKEGKSYEANLVLGSSYGLLKKQIEQIIKETKPTGITTDELLLKSKYIDASLIDAASDSLPTFFIKEIGDKPIREIKDNSTLEWKWSITPLHRNPEGKLYLSLNFYNRKGQSTDENYSDNTSKRYLINVEAKEEEPSSLQETKGFIGKNWDKLLTIIVIPIFLYFFRKYFSNRNPQNP